MKTLILFGFLAVSFTAQAEIYKCKSATGRTVYQADPCAGGAAMGIKHGRATPAAVRGTTEAAAPAAVAAPPSQRERDLALAGKLEDERKARALDRDIEEAERQISILRYQMDEALAGLRAQQKDAANNLAGASWLQSISQEMQAVTSRYQVEIQAEQSRLVTLRAQRAALTP